MTPYPKYKPTGIDWIGEIPENWEVKKLKYWFKLVTCKSDEQQFKIGLENIESKTGKFIQSDSIFEGEGISFDENDILFGKLRPYLAKVYLAEFKGSAVGDFFVIRCKNAILPIYAIKLLLNQTFIEIINSSTFGAKMPRVSWEFMANLLLSIPDINEQTAIAAFLDEKTALIDSFIEKKKKLIELLKEERTAVINHAVTKGIDPDAKLKPSGIDWLGDIPAHWEVKTLKSITSKVGDGLHATPNYEDFTNKYFINGNNLIKGKILTTEMTRTVNDREFDNLKINIKSGSILLSINGTIGNLALYNNEKVILGKSIAYIELLDHNLNKYFYYLFQTEYIKNHFESSLSGTTIKNLSLHTLRNAPMLKTTISAQEQIVEFIETETNKIDITIETIEKEIELMQEYRTALISEVVTGKVRVTE